MPDNQTIRATIRKVDVYLVRASNYQTTNLVFPNFFHEFFSAKAVDKEQTFYWSKTGFFLSLGPMKNSKMLKLRKFRKKIKTRLVVW